MNLNKVYLIGRLTADPQLKSTASGQSVATFGLATNRTWLDKSGAKQEQAEFHNIVVWGRQAETSSQYLKKGAMALIEGRLQTRTWQNKEGQNVKTTEVVAERVQFGPRAMNSTMNDGGGSGGYNRGSQPQEASPEIDKPFDFTQGKPEELPTIDMDEGGEIKADDLPF